MGEEATAWNKPLTLGKLAKGGGEGREGRQGR